MRGLRLSARVHTLLLAAGQASRYGAAKQLLRLDGISLVRRAAQAALDAGTVLTVVTGAHADAVEAELGGLPLRILRHPQWQDGMGSSLACGARSLLSETDLDGVLVLLADQAQVGAAELQRLLALHCEQPQRRIAADHGPLLGPPCLFPIADLPALTQLQGDRGARALLMAEPDALLRVAMPQAAVDIDTPQAWQAFLAARTPR